MKSRSSIKSLWRNLAHRQQPDQDLEVGVWQARVLLQLPFDALEEEPVRSEEAAPRPLFLVVEPAGVAHVTIPGEIVELSTR